VNAVCELAKDIPVADFYVSDFDAPDCVTVHLYWSLYPMLKYGLYDSRSETRLSAWKPLPHFYYWMIISSVVWTYAKKGRFGVDILLSIWIHEAARLLLTAMATFYPEDFFLLFYSHCQLIYGILICEVVNCSNATHI
jgi:hypothetical protein